MATSKSQRWTAPVAAMATTVDQQCASGLEAILAAARRIAADEAEIIVAGGVESLSTAPWRIAKPRSLFQTPHFIRPDPVGAPPMAEHVPHVSCEKLAERLGLAIADFDVIELNEAFASQGLAVLRQLGLPDGAAHVNPNGGAIALGHPLGMSGARLVLTATQELGERNARRALCTMCIGVGQGIALALERV